MASPLAFGGSCVNGERSGVSERVGVWGGVRRGRLTDARHGTLKDSTLERILGGHPYPTPNSTHPSRSCSTIKRNGYLVPPASQPPVLKKHLTPGHNL